MAFKLELRNGLAATWTSTNPVLSQGEIGEEYDTGQFKIGDGVTAWTSLPYSGKVGAAQTNQIRSFGDGSDGNVTISSGITTLSQDMYYNNLTINGTGSIFTNGYRIFVKNKLDLTAAPAGAINFNGVAGGSASGSTGGTITTPPVTGSVGTTDAPTAGATGVTGIGVQATALAALTGNGGPSNTSGSGGAGTNAGIAGGAGVTPTSLSIQTWSTLFVRGITLINGGVSGRGGSSGGGDGTNSGGGGGGGGSAGGVIALYANLIVKSSSSVAGTIQAIGGMGGAGGNGTAGATGGGGGGAGGAGGWVYVAYQYLAGPVITDFIQVTGGMGGTGGNGFGGDNGFTSGIGGSGGSGGYGGRITKFNVINTSLSNEIYPATNTIFNPQVTTGLNALFSVGGTGGLGGMRTSSL